MMIFYKYWLIPYISKFLKAVLFLVYFSKINVVHIGLHYHSVARIQVSDLPNAFAQLTIRKEDEWE
jgi:hypothetical protein